MDFLTELYQCTTLCYKCDHILDFEEVGVGPARTVISKCSNINCDYDRFLKNYPRKIGGLYVLNLSNSYETLLQDSGFTGFVRGNQAKGLSSFCKDTY